MSNYNINNYNILGTLNSNDVYSSYIANKTDDNKTLLINEIPHNKHHQNLFKNMFSYYSSPNKTKDMIDFFAKQDKFYLVFKYQNFDSIEKAFSKKLNTFTYEQRCSILKNLLVKLDSLMPISLNVLTCITDIDNICIDNDNKAVIIYDLSKLNINNEPTINDIFKNIATIISTILKNELNQKSIVELKSIVKKCNEDYYKSIPQLIIELEKAENTFENKNIIKKAKNYFLENKYKLKKYSWTLGVAAFVGFGLFIYNSLFVKGNNKVSDNATTTLGNIQYILNKETTDSSLLINPHSIEFSRPSSSHSLDLTLPSGIELSSEDYIVKNNDTLSSICESYYSNTDFISAVKSFNNMTDENIYAGIILLLPNQEEVYNYLNVNY